MGLDVGSRTVGVAVSDLLGWTAQGIEIIRINEEEENFGFERLGELVKEYEVTKFVVGLPKNMNNSIGPRAEASMAYGDKIQELFQSLFFFWLLKHLLAPPRNAQIGRAHV